MRALKEIEYDGAYHQVKIKIKYSKNNKRGT